MHASGDFRVLPAGDGAIILEFGQAVDASLSDRVFALHQLVIGNPPPGLISSQPTFRSITIQFDPLITDADAILEAIAQSQSGPSGPNLQEARTWRIPACYDESMSLDLAGVAAQSGMTPSEYIRRHAAETYLVYMVGGFPGYPFMGDLDQALRVARLKAPRTSVPPGSIAVAGQFTAIYPRATPGGWSIVGRTPVDIFNPEREPPAIFTPGDRVAFTPIGLEEFGQISSKLAAGEIGVSAFAVAQP